MELEKSRVARAGPDLLPAGYSDGGAQFADGSARAAIIRPVSRRVSASAPEAHGAAGAASDGYLMKPIDIPCAGGGFDPAPSRSS